MSLAQLPPIYDQDADALRLVTGRFGFCSAQPTFFDDFFNTFLQQSSDIRGLFDETDTAEQKKSLREGVSWLLREAVAARGNASLWGETCSPIEAGDQFVVPPAYSDLWLRSLLRAVQKHDPLFDGSHERAWRSVLHRCLEARQGLA
jgi:hypothetical protein